MPTFTAEETLAQSPLFARLPDAERAALSARAEVRVFAPGDHLLESGRPAAALFAVRSGYVKVTLPVSGPGGDPVIDIQGPGSLVGETAATGVGESVVTAVALDAVEAVAIPAEVLHAALSRNYETVLSVMGAVSVSLRGLLAQVTELKMKSTAQRLAMFLVELAPPGTEAAGIALPYSKRIVAEKLGMTPESLSRSLAKLKAAGLAEPGRDGILVPDVDALAEYAGFVPDEEA